MLNQLSESQQFPASSSFSKYSEQELANMLFLIALSLELNNQTLDGQEFVKSYVSKTRITWSSGNTDLGLLSNHLKDKLNNQLLKDWLESYKRPNNRYTYRLLMHLENNLKIDDNNLKSLRKIIANWNGATTEAKALATTRLIQYLNNKARRIDLVSQTIKFGNVNKYYLNNLEDPDLNRKSRLIKNISLIGAGAAGVAALGGYGIYKGWKDGLEKGRRWSKNAGLIEKFVNDGIVNRGYLRNPTKQELINWVKTTGVLTLNLNNKTNTKFEARGVRGIKYNNISYFWNAWDATHHTFANKIGIYDEIKDWKEIDCYYFYIDKNNNIINDEELIDADHAMYVDFSLDMLPGNLNEKLENDESLGMQILSNPTDQELKRFIEKYQEVRGIKYNTKMYFWNAFQKTHDQMRLDLKQFGYDEADNENYIYYSLAKSEIDPSGIYDFYKNPDGRHQPYPWKTLKENFVKRQDIEFLQNPKEVDILKFFKQLILKYKNDPSLGLHPRDVMIRGLVLKDFQGGRQVYYWDGFERTHNDMLDYINKNYLPGASRDNNNIKRLILRYDFKNNKMYYTLNEGRVRRADISPRQGPLSANIHNTTFEYIENPTKQELINWIMRYASKNNIHHVVSLRALTYGKDSVVWISKYITHGDMRHWLEENQGFDGHSNEHYFTFDIDTKEFKNKSWVLYLPFPLLEENTLNEKVEVCDSNSATRPFQYLLNPTQKEVMNWAYKNNRVSFRGLTFPTGDIIVWSGADFTHFMMYNWLISEQGFERTTKLQFHYFAIMDGKIIDRSTIGIQYRPIKFKEQMSKNVVVDLNEKIYYVPYGKKTFQYLKNPTTSEISNFMKKNNIDYLRGIQSGNDKYYGSSYDFVHDTLYAALSKIEKLDSYFNCSRLVAIIKNGKLKLESSLNETASAGATSSGAIASVAGNFFGQLIKRVPDNIIKKKKLTKKSK